MENWKTEEVPNGMWTPVLVLIELHPPTSWFRLWFVDSGNIGRQEMSVLDTYKVSTKAHANVSLCDGWERSGLFDVESNFFCLSKSRSGAAMGLEAG